MTNPPFDPDLLDELLSAWLDGELDAAAQDHGLDPDDVRLRLEGWPGLPARRAELAAARDAVGGPVGELDELTRRRLVRDALDRATLEAAGREPAPAGGRRSRLTALVALGAAAVLLGALVVASSLRGDRHDQAARRTPSDNSAAQDNRAADAASAPLFVGDLGDVSDAAALRERVDAFASGSGGASEEAPSESTTTTAPVAPADPAGPSTTAPAPAPDGDSGDDSAAKLDSDATLAADAQRCADAFAAANAVETGTVLLTAVGTYRDVPATIVVIVRDGRRETWILDRASCAVLAGQAE